MSTIEDLLSKQKEISDKILALTSELNKVQMEIQNEILSLPKIYGRCIKELKCPHNSDWDNYHPTTESTTIYVGDFIEFFRYPLSDFVAFKVNDGEYFNVLYSEEYFEFSGVVPEKIRSDYWQQI
jgi:hypothetical protein